MSALATLAIVAGVLLAAVFTVGVTMGVRTRAMQGRDLALAEALTGEPPSAPRARRLSQVSRDTAEQRRLLERATYRWERLDSSVQSSLARSAARRWGEDPGELSSFINDLIQTGRRPHAGVVLLSVEPEHPNVLPVALSVEEGHEPFEPTPASTVTWYRDQLLALRPAYLAAHASLFARVTQLITLAIRAEMDGQIPQRRRYPLTPRDRG